jgi:hypothetical protein
MDSVTKRDVIIGVVFALIGSCSTATALYFTTIANKNGEIQLLVEKIAEIAEMQIKKTAEYWNIYDSLKFNFKTHNENIKNIRFLYESLDNNARLKCSELINQTKKKALDIQMLYNQYNSQTPEIAAEWENFLYLMPWSNVNKERFKSKYKDKADKADEAYRLLNNNYSSNEDVVGRLLQ